MNGYELESIQMVTDDGPNKREYHCLNCKNTWDGNDTFTEVKKHFGTFPLDEPQHPF